MVRDHLADGARMCEGRSHSLVPQPPLSGANVKPRTVAWAIRPPQAPQPVKSDTQPAPRVPGLNVRMPSAVTAGVPDAEQRRTRVWWRHTVQPIAPLFMEWSAITLGDSWHHHDLQTGQRVANKPGIWRLARPESAPVAGACLGWSYLI